MRLVLLGPPGAGKGTQAEGLAARLNVPHISTGEILRQAVLRGTDLGREARRYIETGRLVPDETVVGVVAERLKEEDCKKGYILDGFPRTLGQAEVFEEELGKSGDTLNAVLYFHVSDDVAIRRLSGRRVCANCGANYHVETLPSSRGGCCERCGGPLVQREDDRPESIAKRLRVYAEETSSLIEYYGKRSLLKKIPADGSVDEVYSKTKEVMGI